MSWWYLLAVAIVAVNAARIRPALPQEGTRRLVLAAGGTAIVLLIGASAIAWAEPLLELLAITPETWRIAAGVVALLAGAWVLAFPSRRDEDGLPGRWAALAPVAFPLILSPELAGFLVLFGATEPASRWLPALVLGLATVPAAAAIEVRRRGLWTAASRMGGALLIALAIAQIIEGIRDV
jgi:small neutral amino acid transporter SnatA (MarC family)